MSWATLALTLVQGFAQLVVWLRERDLINAGEQQAIAAGMHLRATQLLDVEKAVEEQRRRNRAVPPAASLPDDGFRRD